MYYFTLIKEFFRVILLVFNWMLLSLCNGFAQFENVWAFGSYAGIDFNYDPPRVITTSMRTSEGCSSICDDQGNLLFYTDGTSVWDANHDRMPNGFNLTLLNNPDVTSSTSQGTLIVAFPGREGQYYIFSLCSKESGALGRLSYSIVDMSLNGGLGDVVSSQKGIYIGNTFTEHMTAVSGNDCNIWLIVVSRKGNLFHSYNIDYNGIDTNAVVSQGYPLKDLEIFSEYSGCIDISPDRTKLAIAQDRVIIYDLDISSGTITNPIVLDVYPSIQIYVGNSSIYFGVAFSPDNTKLYITSPETETAATTALWQFDLSSGDSLTMANSKTRIQGGTKYGLKRAPDGKIYTGSYGSTALDVIQKPNLLGAACQFEPLSFALGEMTRFLIGLPNMAVIVRDTIYSSQYDSFCISELLISAKDSLGANYLWNNGSTSRATKVDGSGVYWVNYQIFSPRCMDVVDTFHIVLKKMSTQLHVVPSCVGAKSGKVSHKVAWGDNNTYNYQWRSRQDTTLLSSDSFLSNVSSGDYQVFISNSEGCDTTLYFHIPEEEYKVSFMPDTLICKGDEVFFRNQSDAHFEEWFWSFGDEHISSAISPSHIFTDSGTYTVTLIGTGEICTDTAYRSVTVDAPVKDLDFFLYPSAICQGETIELTPYTYGNLLYLHWSFGDQTDMKNTLSKVQHSYEYTGRFYITLTGVFRACPDVIYTDSIIVHEYPKVDLGPDSVLCYQGRPVSLHNHHPKNIGDQYLWSTGSTAESIQAFHYGSYSLTVKSVYGCSTTEHVQVHKDCYTDIPNAFTPNGDGLNDYFFPRQFLTSSVTGFRFQVFNRWGQQVFDTRNADGRGWDGRFNDKEQPMGVYLYTVEVEYDNRRKEVYEGNVTLIK